ncbi:hypothetical protein PSY52_23140, partial [Shigella flexneri]|nr:hypothetical protein [Shigella flexneri]
GAGEYLQIIARHPFPGLADQNLIDDPYRFGPLIQEMDAWLLSEGTHLRPYETLGAGEYLQIIARHSFPGLADQNLIDDP